MRLVVSVLACVGVSGISLALADPPTDAASTAPAAAAPTATAPATAPTAATPATPSGPAAEARPAEPSAAPTAAEKSSVEISATQIDQLEKHFLSEGYKIEMRNGDKYFCRREEQMGSRLGGQKQCSTAQQLQFVEKDSQRQMEHAQHNLTSSPGGSGK